MILFTSNTQPIFTAFAMDKTNPKSSESDDGAEKHIDDAVPVAVIVLPDPDEGLSEEERKRIVCECSRSPTRESLLMTG